MTTIFFPYESRTTLIQLIVSINVLLSVIHFATQLDGSERFEKINDIQSHLSELSRSTKW